MEFPRSAMGKYGQVMVNNMEELSDLIEKNNGLDSVYISHASYPGSERKCDWTGKYCCDNCKVEHADKVRVSQLYFDFDHKSKLENSLADARVFKNWLEAEGLPYTVAFSGKKGFQFLVMLRPAVYSLTDLIEVDADTSVTLSDYYKSLHATLKQDLKLRTLDLKVAEPRRIMRVWNTMHFSKKRGKTGTYCVPMTPEMLDTMSTADIIQYAQSPKWVDVSRWNKDKVYMTFEDFVDHYNISPKITKIENWFPGSVMIADYDFAEGDDSAGKRWFKAMMPDPCVHNSMWPGNTDNPPHISRFASAVWWRKMADLAPVVENSKGKKLKMAPSPEWVDQFYLKMNYIDVGNTQTRHAQINSIFGSTRPYEYPSCATLYAGDICVGEKCPKFKRFLKNINESKDETDA